MRYPILNILIFSILLTFQGKAQLDMNPSPQNHELLEQMNDSIEAGHYEEITSVLIAHHGELIYEKYYQENTINSKHNVRSGTKTIATLLTGIAIDKGYIESSQDPILKYLEHKLPLKNPDERKKEITLDALLSMSSLLECSDDNYASRGNEERMYIIEDWTQFFLDLPIKSFPFSPKPDECKYGRSMSYCSASAATMAEVIESAVEEPLAEFATKNLLHPLGITDYTFHFTPMNILNTAGGSEYRSRDFLKLIQLCLNNGLWEGQQIISADWIELATSPKTEAWPEMEYGYLFWLKSFGPEESKVSSFAMAGNGGQKIIAFPSLDLSVVITTTNYNNRKAHGYTDELLDKYIIPAIQKR